MRTEPPKANLVANNCSNTKYLTRFMAAHRKRHSSEKVQGRKKHAAPRRERPQEKMAPPPRVVEPVAAAEDEAPKEDEEPKPEDLAREEAEAKAAQQEERAR